MRRLVGPIGILLLILVAGPTKGQILFAAFTGDKPAPNRSVEDAQKWNNNVVKPGAILFSEAGGQLQQTLNECGATSWALLPEVKGNDWRDYTVSINARWRDNDGIGIALRWQSEQDHYAVVAGASDGNYNQSWYAGKALWDQGACFEAAQKARVAAQGPLGLVIDESGNTGYTFMVQVEGTKATIFFGPELTFNDLLDGKTPPKVGEVEDPEMPSTGGAAIGTSTCPAFLYNIIVFGPGGPRAVDPQGKLPTAWALLKALH